LNSGHASKFWPGGSLLVNNDGYTPGWRGPATRKVHNDLAGIRCQAQMRIIGSIDDPEVIKKILKHLGLGSAKRIPPPRANAPPLHIHLDYSDSQIPPSEDPLYQEPEYPIDAYMS
jgi:hypothetical protein